MYARMYKTRKGRVEDEDEDEQGNERENVKKNIKFSSNHRGRILYST